MLSLSQLESTGDKWVPGPNAEFYFKINTSILVTTVR